MPGIRLNPLLYRRFGAFQPGLAPLHLPPVDAPTLQSLHRWFRGYAGSFAEADGRLHPMQELKLEHSLRVAANARTIAEGLGWPPPARVLGEACGLLHDVGRFSQLQRFKTVVDRHSVNHAEHSAEVIEHEKVLDECADGTRRRVLAAVRHHNRLELPPDLTPDELLTTTRSVRRRLDLTRTVDDALVEECVRIAQQAPNGSNREGWHFLVVTDAGKRRAVADLYRTAWEGYANNPALRPTYDASDPRATQLPRIIDSAGYLAHHLHEAPVHVIRASCAPARHLARSRTAHVATSHLAPRTSHVVTTPRPRRTGCPLRRGGRALPTTCARRTA